MFAKLCAKRNKKGFTLAELLIVVAIIAVLVAIAIPVFSAQLTKAEERVNEANQRTAEAMAVATDLLENEGDGGTYYFNYNATTHNIEWAGDKATSGNYKVEVGKAGQVISSSGSYK